jgi:hypothetical protein
MTRLFACLTLCLAFLAAHQYRSLERLRAELVQRQSDNRRFLARELNGMRDDFTRTGLWLHEFYKSSEGLERPEGMWLGDRPDFEAISTWLVEVYLPARLTGASEEAARGRIVEEIRASAEWRAKH